jgi:hypothetical protein
MAKNCKEGNIEFVNFEAVGSKEKDSHVNEFFYRYKKSL